MPDLKYVLFQGPHEAFRDAVSFRLSDEAGRAGHPQEGQLGLEVVAHVGAAVVVADRQPGGDALLEAAEVLADALTERLQRLEAVARLGGVQADALSGTVIHRDEDAALAFLDGHGG